MLAAENEMSGAKRLLFRKDLSRSLTDHHVRHAIEDRTIRGLVLNISGGAQTYETDVRRFPENRMLVTDWLNSQTRNRVHVFCDAHLLPFRENAVDSILMTEVLEHLGNPRQALKEAFRVLRDDGALLLTTPFLYQAHQRPFDFFRYTYDGLWLLVREAGFQEATAARRGESFAVALNALKSWAQQRKLSGRRMRVTTWALEKLERGYIRWYAHRSFQVPISRDPMALGYTVVAKKRASIRPAADGALGSGSRTWSISP